jgi:6,7-dimethyl-8-ribityllumazine synthase
MDDIQGQMSAAGKTIGVVVSRWNELITKQLLEGALEELAAHGNPEVVVVHVPGAWEIPPAAKALIEDRGVDAVVALGCILMGATSAAKVEAKDTSAALMRIQLDTGRPVTWGVLTPDNQEQALERSGLKMGNKGREAASAAIEMVSVLESIRADKR